MKKTLVLGLLLFSQTGFAIPAGYLGSKVTLEMALSSPKIQEILGDNSITSVVRGKNGWTVSSGGCRAVVLMKATKDDASGKAGKLEIESVTKEGNCNK